MIERYFIYFPERRLAWTPTDMGLEFEDLRFHAADGTGLHGWLVPGDGEIALLWFHGNAGNIGDRVELLAELHRELGIPILILEYRGYGDSDGKPSEPGLYMDAEAALGALTERLALPTEGVAVFGQSLGSAVAVELATRQRTAGLILEAPFTSAREMARRHYPWLPMGRLMRTRFDSLSKIGEVGAPLLIVHGADDEIVPVAMAEKLLAAAREPKRLLEIPGATHNDAHLVGRSEYFAPIREFVSELEAGGSAPEDAG